MMLSCTKCLVNLFRSILPVIPSECDVLIVGNIMTIIVHFTIEHQVYYDGKFKEQHAKIWEILRGRKVLSPPWFQHCGAERLRRLLYSDVFVMSSVQISPLLSSFEVLFPVSETETFNTKFKLIFVRVIFVLVFTNGLSLHML